MEKELYDLHLNAAKIAGKEKSCGKKVNYQSENSATKAAFAMNTKTGIRTTLEPYPCPFCNGWHIGRKMSISELKRYSDAHSGL